MIYRKLLKLHKTEFSTNLAVRIMKHLLIFFIILFSPFPIFASELIEVKLFDGEILKGKLSLPADTRKIKELVIYIHGTGPGTYLNRRKIGSNEFNYFDVFAEEFNRRGIAFFSYSKRGVEISNEPPLYETVDREKFKKVIPSVEVKDLAATIKFLRRDKRLKRAKIILLGWSEGSVIASMLAEDRKNKISALFLAGYVHENMSDVIKWQYSGASSMIILRKAFDKDGDGNISKAEYESDEKAAAAMRTGSLQNAKFEQLDINRDDLINAKDFGQLVEPRYKMILEKIRAKDEDWIWNNFFRVSIDWLNEHFKLEANKTRLLRLKIPIYIFQGEDDANCDVNWVYDLKERFAENNKTNLQAFVFKEHNHDLNFLNWAIGKKTPGGIKKIFEVSEQLNK